MIVRKSESRCRICETQRVQCLSVLRSAGASEATLVICEECTAKLCGHWIRRPTIAKQAELLDGAWGRADMLGADD